MALTKVKGHILADDLALGGNPTTSTQSTGNNTTRIATTAFVQTELAALVDSSPDSLNTLNELAAALGDDANFSTTVTNSIATKLPLAGGTMTGALTINSGGANTSITTSSSDAANWMTMTDPSGSIFFGNSGANYQLWVGAAKQLEVTSSTATFSGQLQATNSATTTHELIVTGNNTRSAISMQSKDSSGNAVDLRMHSLGDGPRGEIFTYTNHDLAFATNNAAPQMILKTDGKFGIGTTGPTKSLSVKAPSGSNGGIDVFHNNGNKIGELVHHGSGDEGRLSLYDGGTSTIQLHGETGQDSYINSGKFGIGTTSPATGLHVVTAGGTTPFRVQGGANSGVNIMEVGYAGGSAGANFIVDDNGRVGVGTSSPQSLLHVHTASAGSNYIRITNNDSGSGSGDGMLVGLASDEAATVWNLENTSMNFGTNNQENFRLRTDGGIQFPDNNTFIATSSTAGGTAYEWGSIRRPASSDGGQLSIRQYSTGDTAASYPAYAGGRSGWDENTGMFFYDTDEVGFSAGGNATLWVEAGKKWEAYSNGFTDSAGNRGHRVCLGGIAHNPNSNPGGSGSGGYLHIKTNVPKSNVMFRFEYKGFSYNDRNMDTSITGYTYTGSSTPYTPTIQDTGDTVYNFKTPYYSSDNKLVLVLQVAANYTGGILWAQFCGSHTMTPGSVAIVSTINSSSTSGAF